jgi:hypothetical protein
VGIGTTNPNYPLTIDTEFWNPLRANSSANGATVIEAHSTAASGSGWGVFGSTHSQDAGAYGVYGNADAGGAAIGVLGAASGIGQGVQGDNYGEGGNGVYGNATNANGSGNGVSGRSATATGSGVYGEATNADGSGNGVSGRSATWYGAGVYGVTTSASTSAAGVSGHSDSYADAVLGINTANNGWAVHGVASSSNGIGVIGETNGSGMGVYGINYDPSGYGVFSGGNLFVNGNSTVTGAKSAIVPTSQGDRKFYSQESPEVWFEDFGEGQLAGGTVHIDLAPLFLETVTIDDQHPMKVFIQLNDDCNGVYVQRQATGFQVMELSNGNSSAHFSYRVVAKRKGFADTRLEAGPSDALKAAGVRARRK